MEKAQAEDSLSEFIKQAWEVIEPGQPYVHGWHIDFLCEHLEAITYGFERDDGSTYNRLLINIPPGTMKSLTVNRLLAGMGMGTARHGAFALCLRQSQPRSRYPRFNENA